MAKVKVNPYTSLTISWACQCPRCLNIIFSRNVWDEVTCSCKGTSIHGKEVSITNSFNHMLLLDDFPDNKPPVFKLVVPYTDKALMFDAEKHIDKLGQVEVRFPNIPISDEE